MNLLEELQKIQEEENAAIDNNPANQNQNILIEAASNVPGSALQFGKDLINPILHPIETATSLKDLGVGIYQLLTPGVQPEEEIANAVGNYFAERYGGLENIKNTFAKDPVGFLGDASIILTGGAGLAAKAPQLAGKTTSAISKVGNVIDPVQQGAKAASFAADKVGGGVADILGLSTGAGGDAIKTATQAGKVGGQAEKSFIENMRGKASAEEIVQQASDKIKDMSQSSKQKLKSGKTKLQLESKPIEIKNIRKSFDDFTKSKSFEGMSELSIKAQNKLENINKIIKEFETNPKLHNAKGLDMLKRRIDAEYPTGLNVGDSGMVVTAMRNKVKNQILKEVPEYGDVMKAYEEAITLEKQIAKELSLGNKTAAGTTLRKLLSVMRNNVNTNFGNRLEMVQKLDPELLPALAGQSLSNITPSGIQRVIGGGQVGATALGYVDPINIIPGLAIQSPRLVGEAALKSGQLQKAISTMPKVIPDTLKYIRPSAPALEEGEKQKELNYLNSLLNK